MSLGLEISCTRSHSASSTFATIRNHFYFFIKVFNTIRTQSQTKENKINFPM